MYKHWTRECGPLSVFQSPRPKVAPSHVGQTLIRQMDLPAELVVLLLEIIQVSFLPCWSCKRWFKDKLKAKFPKKPKLIIHPFGVHCCRQCWHRIPWGTQCDLLYRLVWSGQRRMEERFWYMYRNMPQWIYKPMLDRLHFIVMTRHIYECAETRRFDLYYNLHCFYYYRAGRTMHMLEPYRHLIPALEPLAVELTPMLPIMGMRIWL